MLNGDFGVGDAVTFASVGAVDDGAELTAVGAGNPSVVVWLLGAVAWGAVAVGVGVANALVGFNGLTGDTGLVTFVGFVKLLTHEFTVLSDQMPCGQVFVLVLVICPV